MKKRLKPLKDFTVFFKGIDWLTVIGEIPHIDYLESEIDIKAIDKTMDELGVPFHSLAKRRVYFNPDTGVEVAFSKKRGKGSKMVSISLKGHACLESMESMEKKIKNIVNFIWKKLGVMSIPKVTRLDIAVDIIGAKVFDVIPDFENPDYKVESHNDTGYTHDKFYKDKNNPSLQTGARIKNSRCLITCYERMLTMNLDQRSIHYIQYYNEIYGEAQNVLRIETRMFKELCKYFNVAFFTGEKDLKTILQETMAHFIKSHRFLYKGKPLKSIDEIYCMDNYKSLKTLEKELDLKIPLSQIAFNQVNPNVQGKLRTLAKAMLANKTTSEVSIMYTMVDLKKMIEQEADNVEERTKMFKNAMDVFGVDEQYLQQNTKEWESLKEEIRNLGQCKAKVVQEVEDKITIEN